MVTTDAFRQHLVVYGRPEDGITWPFWGSDPNAGMLAEFVVAIREGREPAITGLDGLRALEIVEAAYRSVGSGAPAQIRWPGSMVRVSLLLAHLPQPRVGEIGDGGGDEGTRTPGLRDANAALFQLSYIPTRGRTGWRRGAAPGDRGQSVAPGPAVPPSDAGPSTGRWAPTIRR